MKFRIAPIVFSILFCIVPRPAHAYLDPGTGSMVLQLVIAGVLGALFTIKNWWHSVRAFAARLMGK